MAFCLGLNCEWEMYSPFPQQNFVENPRISRSYRGETLSNFNMAVSILFSLLIGWEVLPEGRSTMFLLAILGNLAAFTGFTAKQ